MVITQGYAPPPKNGVEQKRPGRPLNITSLVRLSSAVPNQIVVTWAPEIGKVCEVPLDLLLHLFRFQHCFSLFCILSICMYSLFLFLQTYSMSVYLVRQLTSPLLLQRLRMKGIRNPDHSRALSKFCRSILFVVIDYLCIELMD